MLLIMGELILSIHAAESISTDCHHQRVTDYLVICVCLVKVYTQ